jgi:hypothetical protein
MIMFCELFLSFFQSLFSESVKVAFCRRVYHFLRCYVKNVAFTYTPNDLSLLAHS